MSFRNFLAVSPYLSSLFFRRHRQNFMASWRSRRDFQLHDCLYMRAKKCRHTDFLRESNESSYAGMWYGAHLLIHPADSSLLLFNTRNLGCNTYTEKTYLLTIFTFQELEKPKVKSERFDKSKKSERKNICGWEQFQRIKAQRKKLTQCCCYVILSTGFGNQYIYNSEPFLHNSCIGRAFNMSAVCICAPGLILYANREECRASC